MKIKSKYRPEVIKPKRKPQDLEEEKLFNECIVDNDFLYRITPTHAVRFPIEIEEKDNIQDGIVNTGFLAAVSSWFRKRKDKISKIIIGENKLESSTRLGPTAVKRIFLGEKAYKAYNAKKALETIMRTGDYDVELTFNVSILHEMAKSMGTDTVKIKCKSTDNYSLNVINVEPLYENHDENEVKPEGVLMPVWKGGKFK